MEAVRMEIEEQTGLPVGVYGVLLENDRVRVLDIRLEPGETSPMHTHLGPSVLYALTDGQARFTFPDGRSQIVQMKTGEAAWSDLLTHEVQNIGDTELHVLNIEIKE